jgi:hypothetical protein
LAGIPQPKPEKGDRTQSGGERIMLDAIFIAATALFFTVGIFYVRGCERLK